MLTLIIRAILIYLLVLLVFRLMGKRQIGQMQPFELVLTLVIADLATIPMAESAIPTLNGIVPLIALVVVHFCLVFLSKRSPKVSNFISGKPVIIMDQNGINVEAIEKLDVSVEDIFEAIRQQGYFSLEDVQYAIMETNGTVSVLPKSTISPVTAKDVGIEPSPALIPVTLISEGKIMAENLSVLGVKEDFVQSVLEKKNIKTFEDVVVFTADLNGACFLQEKTKPCQTFEVKLEASNE